MDKTEKRSFRQIAVNTLKTIGLLYWATRPIVGSMNLIGLQFLMSYDEKMLASLAFIAFIIFSISWIWNYYKKHTNHVSQKIGLKDFGIAFGLFILMRIIAVAGTLLNALVTGNAMTSNDAALQSSNPLAIFPLFLILFNLTMGIFTPILEELTFRGIFIEMWFKPERKWLPAFITSAIFSLAHGFDNVITFSMYFAMGLTLYFAYDRRKNIKDSILVHVLNNGFIMMISLISYLILYFS